MKRKTAKKKNSITEKKTQFLPEKYDSLRLYMAEIREYKLLSREEEKELGIRFREEKDMDAAYRLVVSNLRLVVKIAMDFSRYWMNNLLDLIQEGNIGLMQAVRKFDPYRNVKFSYYASFWIKAYIIKFIMDNFRMVKIGTTQHQRKLFFKLKKVKQELQEEGFDPHPKLLSERLNVPEHAVIDMDMRMSRNDVSLNSPLREESDAERIDFLPADQESPEELVGTKQINRLVRKNLSAFRHTINKREKDILDSRIMSDSPMTLRQLGERYCISRERVRQVEKNIRGKMEKFLRDRMPNLKKDLQAGRAAF